jgi:hypothetical protein
MFCGQKESDFYKGPVHAEGSCDWWEQNAAQ